MNNNAEKQAGKQLPITYRFINRSDDRYSSTGRFNIVRVGENSSYIYMEDWFHTVSSQSTFKVVCGILVFYFISVLFWATMFYLFRNYGFVDITTYVSAMIISLETITTVGYSVTDIQFGNHTLAFFLLYGEMMQAILMNSFCIGIIYTRLSRGLTRTQSIIFSSKAIIRKVEGKWCFMFQICELRRHQLIGSTVTCYCIQKTVNSTSGIPFQMSRMVLKNPDDARGSRLVLMLPAIICHEIDSLSPLMPRSSMNNKGLRNHRMSRCFTSSNLIKKPCRAVSQSKQNEICKCNQCSKLFCNESFLDEHISEVHLQDDDSTDSLDELLPKKKDTTYQEIINFIRKADLEIVVLVEGTESVTSRKLQARFSYAAEDITTNCTFKPCVSIGEDGEAVIDFEKFYGTVPIDASNEGKSDLFIQSIL